jgi:hypothetical protein
MFLHHTMTDAEILRSCEGCTSQHLRLVADRLRDRVDGMREINRMANAALVSHDLEEIRDALQDIIDESKPEGN